MCMITPVFLDISSARTIGDWHMQCCGQADHVEMTQNKYSVL